MSQQTKEQKKIRIKRKIRATISGTSERPRMSVYRSNKYISVQLIDDTQGKTLLSASDAGLKGKTKMEGAILVGKSIAEKAEKQSIKKIVFDRNGFKYAGRIKALADSARASGLEF